MCDHKFMELFLYLLYNLFRQNEEQPEDNAGRIFKELYNRKAIKQLRRHFCSNVLF